MSSFTLDSLRAYLLSKKGATEETPFGPDALVFKVMGKMFALLAWQSDPLRITLKCDPDDVLALRQQYAAVQPGYYMNNRHWNTVTLDGSIPEADAMSGCTPITNENGTQTHLMHTDFRRSF